MKKHEENFTIYENESDNTVDKSDDYAIDLDDLLPKIGEFGLYQKLLLWLVCLPACLPCGFCAFNQLFMTEVPDYWCKVPELATLNLTEYERKTLSIPRKDNTTFESCFRYSLNWSMILLTSKGEIEVNESWPIEPCYDGYNYNTSEIASSIVIDFDLVCDYDVYPTLGLVALNIGGPIGVYTFGYLNDSIGRKKTFFLCLTTLLVGSIMTAYAYEFWFWILARVIVGLTIPAMYQIPFIISLELAGPNYRSFVTVMTCVFYTVGLILLSGVTYFLRDWRSLALATSIPFIFYYLYWFVLPESPRWLLMRERLEEANNILKTIAKVNGNVLPEEYTIKLQKRFMKLQEKDITVMSSNMFSLCRTPNMRLKTCLITLNWCASEMVYVGLSYYGPAIGDNQYVSFFLSSVVEIPSYLICWILMDRIGRRWPLCLSMIVSGIFCIVTVLLPEDAVIETLILYLISKCFISASFLIIYPYAGELYPTELRGVGIGTSAYIGGMGLIIIPFVNYLGSSNLVLPLVVMGVLSVIGGLCALRLPETLHCPLPQTAEEGEEFGKNWTYKECFTCGGQSGRVTGSDSYENLDQLELTQTQLAGDETPNKAIRRRSSMKHLVRQTSIVDTQRDIDGNMRMTYWF